MDKNKIKEELKKKLNQEMSVTGTGASFTSGGDFVASKYAYGKRDNKGTPKDWKDAPSIPNRPSKAIDYKELWEVVIPDNIKKFAQRKGVTDIVNQVARWSKKAGYDIVGGTAIGKDYSTLILDLTYQGSEVYINTDNDTIEVKGEEVDNYDSFVKALKEEMNEGEPKKISLDDYLNKLDFTEEQIKNIKAAYSDRNKSDHSIRIQIAKLVGADKAKQIQKWYSNDGYLNENYARFRNETKTRTKPEQFHSAVKDIKKKVNEINRLFEYMDRLQSELSESEGGLKYKKYTEKSIQQIKESTKQLFFKSTKLK